MTATDKWPKASRLHPCPKCGHINRCLVAPDGTAVVCFRNGGKVEQLAKHNANGNGHGTGYVGAAHRKLTRKAAARGYASAEAAIKAIAHTIEGGEHVGTWTYPGDVMRVLRFDLADGDKTFRPMHQKKNEWREGDPSGALPLYRGDELPAAGMVAVTEGEKAADAARNIGLPAVTSAHGSAAAEKTDWTPLAGRDVVILPDHDEPGEKYARSVARSLVKLDPPARVKIVKLPGLPEGGDMVEFIDARDSHESESIRGEIESLAAGVPFIDPAELIGGPVIVCAADVEPREISWLWPQRIPMGRITLIVGRPGEGKSFFTIDAAARVTTGTPWPDGSECPRGSVLIVSAEDDPADTIRPRLDAHCADVHKVHLLSGVRRVTEEGQTHEVIFTLADVHALEAALKKIPDCKLIVIDPIGSFLGGDTDAHRDNEVRGVLAPVAKLAERYGAAVLVVAHRRKSSGNSADDLAIGSRAFTGIARAVWHLTRDTENKVRRLLLPGKNNLAPEGDGLAFTIAGDPPCIRWEREPVRMSADDALAVENGDGDEKPGPEPIVRNMAEEWLRKELADLQEHPVATLEELAKAAAVGSWKTVQRAADKIGVISHRATFGGGYVWRLPKPAPLQDTMQDTSIENNGTCPPVLQGENPTKTGDSAGQIPLQDKLVPLVPHEVGEAAGGGK